MSRARGRKQAIHKLSTVPVTAILHDDLNYAPLTPTEREMIVADHELNAKIAHALEHEQHALVADLIDEKAALEQRFQALRAHTWHRWMETEFPAAMAQYAGRRTA